MRSIILLSVIFLSSCSSLQSVYYNANTQRQFATSQSYIETIAKETGLESNRIIILKEEAFNNIAADIVKDGLSTYYGIVYNSEIISANELNIKSCQGQIVQLYHAIPDASGRFSKSGITSFRYFDTLHFNPEKKTLILLYSYKLGGVAKAKILPVIDELKKDLDFEYYVISLDNSDIAK
ncbi:hypothetical protein [Flavobacterium sp.]|uniref:hypothetical protein n=1 Tax=Flavobacterium sp. TaxID=239 RepID=UPI004033614B